MTKYLFFCFGDFNKSSTDNILNQVASCSDKDKMFYQDGNGYIIIHLFSNDSLKYLRNNFTKNLSNMTNCQFLFEDDEYYDNIVNKEQYSNDYPMKEIMEKMEVLEDYDFIKKLDDVIKDFIDDNKFEDTKNSFECDEDYEDSLITTTVKKEYFLDEILDKISEKGVSSLTKEELNFLNSFSK